VLEEMANAMAGRIAAKDLTVQVEVAEDAGTFIADERRVRQVLSHLLDNAIGFAPATTAIRMGARREGRYMLLWVSDTGRGIDPEFQAQAFERFQARPVTGGHRGPGLGLALVKSFVELHHGQVKLLSQLNRGTTVICRFPVAGPPAESAGRRAAEASAAPTVKLAS
jgi:signal transduction histidine kinase